MDATVEAGVTPFDTAGTYGPTAPARSCSARRQAALRKLRMLDATELGDLRVPPGNRLERLKGDRAGQHSIRINDQWRICFRWSGGDAHDVEITDYH